MSFEASDAFIASFTARVKHQYQGKAKLAGTTREELSVVGSTKRFDTHGELVMGTHIPLSRVTFSNPAIGSATATLADYNLSTLSSMFDGQKLIWSEVEASQKAVGNAAGRRVDQIKINAMAAATFDSSNSIAYNISGTPNNAMNVFKIRRAMTLLDNQDVPAEDRYWAMRPGAFEQLLGTTPVTSNDYNAVKALVHGEVDTFLGFKFIKIAPRTEGGIPLNTGTRYYSFAWHKEAVGYAEGIAPKLEIKPADEYRSTAVYMDLSAGAIAIDSEGIIRVEYDEAVAVVTNES